MEAASNTAEAQRYQEAPVPAPLTAQLHRMQSECIQATTLTSSKANQALKRIQSQSHLLGGGVAATEAADAFHDTQTESINNLSADGGDAFASVSGRC